GTGFGCVAQIHLGLGRHLGAHVVAQARADVADGPGDLADAAGGAAHVVEVLGIPARWMQVQLVKARATPEDEFFPEVVVARDEADQLGREKVLLDLVRGWPWRHMGPGGDVVGRDQRSGSISVLTATRHRWSTGPSGGLRRSRAVIGARRCSLASRSKPPVRAGKSRLSSSRPRRRTVVIGKC